MAHRLTPPQRAELKKIVSSTYRLHKEEVHYASLQSLIKYGYVRLRNDQIYLTQQSLTLFITKGNKHERKSAAQRIPRSEEP